MANDDDDVDGEYSDVDGDAVDEGVGVGKVGWLNIGITLSLSLRVSVLFCSVLCNPNYSMKSPFHAPPVIPLFRLFFVI